MSAKASDYTWQLKIGSTPRKLLLTRMAKMADGERHSYYFRVEQIATYLEMPKNKVSGYLTDLQAAGLVSILERTYVDGGRKESRIFIHGPWDYFGGLGAPFEEIEPHPKDKNFAPAQAVEITPQIRKELRERFAEYAEEDGTFVDGNPRSRWRLGSRAHSIVCWYGLGNTVIHDGRLAKVTAITNTGHRGRPIPEQVTLAYLDGEGGTVEGVLVEALSEPEQAAEEQAPEQPRKQATPQNPSSEGSDQTVRGGGDQMVRGVVTKRSGHGVTKRSGLESSFKAKRKSSSSDRMSEAGEEEEESPSALGGIEGAVAIVMDRTDAAQDEAQALVGKFIDAALSRGKELIKPDEYVRRFKKGDLEYHLSMLRRQRAPQPRPGAPKGGHRRCSLPAHGELTPCGSCKADLRLGGEARQAVVDMYLNLGPDAPQLRPDLAANPVIADLVAA